MRNEVGKRGMSILEEVPSESSRPPRLARLYRLPRRIQILGILLLLLGSGTAYRIYDYTENDPNFCLSCHIMKPAWDRWRTSEHQKVNCHACHQQSKLQSLRQVWLTLVEHPEKVGPHGHLNPAVCARCHLNGNPRWKQIADTAGHKVHVEQEKIPCWRCHAKSIHRFRPPAEVCKECHPKQTLTIAPMARLHCTSCHNYLAHQVTLLPTRNDCLWCHQRQLTARVIFKEDSPMQYECQTCHNPHHKQSPLASCQRCHKEFFISQKPNSPRTAHQDCFSCHRPHTWRTEKDTTCRSCHNPLPKGFVHVEGHRVLQCTDCHTPHHWKAQTNGLCTTCHRAVPSVKR